MRSVGLTVSCTLPIFALLLVSNRTRNRAFAACRGDPIPAPVVFRVNSFVLSASSARLNPLSVAVAIAARMKALVLQRREQFKVFDAVVVLSAISMMDLIAFRDGSVVLLPDNNVLHSLSLMACVVPPDIAFLSSLKDSSSRLRSAFPHV